MSKVLITGGTGFIGSSLIPLLLAEGYEVRVLLRKSNLSKHLKGLRIEIVQGSLEDQKSLQNAVAGVDYIVHLAGVVASSKIEKFYKVNVEGTRNLVNAVDISKSSVKCFLHVSSLAAGGPMVSKEVRLETMTDEPVSHYGKSKLQAEEELLKFNGKFPMVILRPPIVYGPEDKGVLIIIKSALQKITPMLRPSGGAQEKAYSMIYVKDLCSGILLLLKQDKYTSGEKFYISDGNIYCFDKILDSVATVTGKKGIRISLPFFIIKLAAVLCEWVTAFFGKPLPLNRDKVNELKPNYWICSNEKIKSIGFVPKYPLQKGMSETIKWYQLNGWI